MQYSSIKHKYMKLILQNTMKLGMKYSNLTNILKKKKIKPCDLISTFWCFQQQRYLVFNSLLPQLLKEKFYEIN